jgi:hypothetical protein
MGLRNLFLYAFADIPGRNDPLAQAQQRGLSTGRQVSLHIQMQTHGQPEPPGQALNILKFQEYLCM